MKNEPMRDMWKDVTDSTTNMENFRLVIEQIWFSDIRPPPGPNHETKPDYLSKIHMYYLFCYLKIYSLFQVVNYEADPIHGFHAEGAGVPKYPH